VVAADGGAAKAAAMGIEIDAIVGDLDSLPAFARAAFPAAVVSFIDDPDRSDMEKAVEFCLARGAAAIDIIAAGGGRADHALANLSVLTLFRGHAVRIVDDAFAISLVDSAATIEGEAGTIVSLVALGVCVGVTTSGLRWDLTEATLPFSTRGVHNELAARSATVRLREGDLLLFQGHHVERHS